MSAADRPGASPAVRAAVRAHVEHEAAVRCERDERRLEARLAELRASRADRRACRPRDAPDIDDTAAISAPPECAPELEPGRS